MGQKNGPQASHARGAIPQGFLNDLAPLFPDYFIQVVSCKHPVKGKYITLSKSKMNTVNDQGWYDDISEVQRARILQGKVIRLHQDRVALHTTYSVYGWR